MFSHVEDGSVFGYAENHVKTDMRIHCSPGIQVNTRFEISIATV